MKIHKLQALLRLYKFHLTENCPLFAKNQNKVGCEEKSWKRVRFGENYLCLHSIWRKKISLPLQNLFLWIFLKKLGKIRCQLISHEIRRGWSWHGRHWHCCRGCLLLRRSLLCTSCCGCCTATVQPHHGLLINFGVTKFRFITFWISDLAKFDVKIEDDFFCFSDFDFQVNPTKCWHFSYYFSIYNCKWFYKINLKNIFIIFEGFWPVLYHLEQMTL